MIKGAVQIIGGIPGRYLDPFHVAESQPECFSGYVLIAAGGESRTWDVLLLAGKAITGAASVEENHRGPAVVTDVRGRFCRFRDRSRVFLFEAPELKMRLFEKTLCVVPALKFRVDSLSRKQMVRLIKDVPGTRFVAERVVSQPLFPLIELLEIRSPDQQIEFELRFRKGLLVLYRMDGPMGEGEQISLSLGESEEPLAGRGSRKGAGLGGKAPGFPGANAAGSVDAEGGRDAEDESGTREAPGVEEENVVAEFRARFNEAASGVARKGTPPLTGTGGELFTMIPGFVTGLSPFRRSRFRRTARELLGQFYSEKYDQLKELELVESVEACYRELKG